MARLDHPGYAEWKFNKRKMGEILDSLIPNLPQAAANLQADCLIVHGTSGVWMAGLLVMLQDLPVVLVRKPNEDSHGYSVEGPIGEFHRGLVIDDTVCSGQTVNRIQSILDAQGTRIAVCGVAVYLSSDTEWGLTMESSRQSIPVRGMAKNFPVRKPATRMPEYRDDWVPTINPVDPNEPARAFEASIKTMPVYGSGTLPSSLLKSMVNRL